MTVENKFKKFFSDDFLKKMAYFHFKTVDKQPFKSSLIKII